jgi:membrane associated rhomboid family serine protease
LVSAQNELGEGILAQGRYYVGMEKIPEDDPGGHEPDGYREYRLTEDGWSESPPPLEPEEQPEHRTRGIIWSLMILGACIAVFIVSNILQLVPLQQLVFSPGNGLVFPGILTHIFAHANFMHLMGNMFVLFFLGTVVERSYGSWRYLVLYFVSGIFAALAEGAVIPAGYMLGASGALAGVMAAFVRHYPKTMLYIWGVAPVPAWLFILFWLGYNIWGAGAGSSLNVAFMAHLGGFFAGMIVSFLLVPPHQRIRKVLG